MSNHDDFDDNGLDAEPGMLDDDDLGLVDPETLAEADAAEEDAPAGDAERIEALENELAVTKDRMMRLAADLENTRRRAQKEKTEAAQYGISGFARDLLSVADNFERALNAAPGEGEEVTADSMAGLMNGIKMTEKELLTVLQRHGVTRLFPKGEKFDPNLHPAIAHVPGSNGEAQGHVVDVAQPGFVLADRVLRPAMVTVSSGPAE